MNGRNFARQRALILRDLRPSHQRKALDRLIRDARATVVTVRGKLVGYQLPDGYMVCEKLRIRTAEAAQVELDNVRLFARVQREGRVPIRAYHCDYCKGWHLTSEPARHSHSEAA